MARRVTIDAMRVLVLALLAAAFSALGAETLLIDIPAGPFRMGSERGPADEHPAHEVVLPAFSIERVPVSNAQFAGFLNRAGPRSADGARYFDDDDRDARIHRVEGRWVADRGYEAHPVVEASWRGAAAYCASLGRRLPTEAEWEKAARGTDGRRYPWGDAPPDASRAQFAAGYNQTVPVGSFPAAASPYGVLDMAGNVWQWVSSLYRPYPYRAEDGREDPGDSGVRGTRGGGHDWGAEEITAMQRGSRLSRAPGAGHHNIGFRCAR